MQCIAQQSKYLICMKSPSLAMIDALDRRSTFVFGFLASVLLASFFAASSAYAHHVSSEISVIASPLKMSLAEDFLFVSNLGVPEVSIIDITSDTLVGNISTEAGVMSVEAIPEKNRIYVASFESGGIDVYELDSREYVKTVPLQNFRSESWAVFQYADWEKITHLNGGWSMDYNPLNGMLYVANYNGNSITVIDTDLDVPVSSVSVPAHPFTAKVDPEAKMVLVASLAGSRLTFISTETNEIINTLNTGCGPWGLDIDIENHLAYVTHRGCFYIAVVDIATQEVIAKIPVGDASQAVTVDKNENMIYASYFNQDKILKIDGRTKEIISTIEMGPGAIPFDIIVDPESHKLYASIKGRDSVMVMGPRSISSMLTVSTIDSPHAVLGAVHAHGQDVEVSDLFIDLDKMSLEMKVSTGDGGDLTLEVPRFLMDAKDASGQDSGFQVLLDGRTVDHEDVSNDDIREITVFVPRGATNLEIVGTSVIPELGPAVLIALAVAIGAMIAASRRMRLPSF
jgi:DNA-binding beta-propeller fold protein YncE